MKRTLSRARAAGTLAFTTALLVTCAAHAADFYVDPATGADAGDGSVAKPWKMLEQVAKSGAFGTTIGAGDTVWLRSGHHGAPVLQGGDFTPAVTIAAAPGAKATTSRVTFKGAKGLTLRGVSISASYDAAPTAVTLVSIDDASARVTLDGNELFSVADASGWGATEWIDAASSGIDVSGSDVVVRGNRLRNVRFGIVVDGPRALVDRNSVDGFSADGLRGLGDDGVFQYNVVKNCYVSDTDGDDNHDDGFQSWSVGAGGVGTGVVKGIVLRGNVFLNREDPNQKLQNSMQGIGCFDGFFEGWVVENNVVITDHWHGISFYGMRKSRIVNNTVIDVNDTKPGPPWIMVTDHKDGTPSEDVVVRNNLATDFNVSGTNVTEDHDTTLTDLTKFFVDPAKLDLHLLPTAPAVDTGSADLAPPLDIEGIARPQGAGVDLGAYEWHDPSVEPADAGLEDAAADAPAVEGGAGGGGGQGGGGASDATVGSDAPTESSAAGGGAGEAQAASDESSGCGCKVGGRAPVGSAWSLLAVGVGLLARRGRGGRRRG